MAVPPLSPRSPVPMPARFFPRKLLRPTVLMGALLLLMSLLSGAPQSARASSGTWQQFTYSGPAGSRPYFVYTPVGYHVGTAVPLFVMLHGCTQTPADFATGTQMDQLADTHQFIVVYPQQTSQYNSAECW